MIPYELIIPSAARPHLLERVLGSLLARVDQLPERVLVHNDERFPDRRPAVTQIVQTLTGTIPYWLEHHDPPIKHGPALHRLLNQVKTEYVLYSQDDHAVVRPLPVSHALQLLHQHELNQIRFNKRDTMDKKGREGAEFYKREFYFFRHPGPESVLAQNPVGDEVPVTLCAADHWYFQTGVWRVAAIKPVVDWWATAGSQYGAFDEHMEVKINQVFNGQWVGKHPVFPLAVPICPDPAHWNDPLTRAAVHRTFIWGKIGELAFVQHIGDKPEDWALARGNRDPYPKGT